uniref:Uncharacterized protein n=1 Tax=Pseudo-nitzschia delicatissima TaxID=44447 RepID=A0A7S0T8G4_9STRA
MSFISLFPEISFDVTFSEEYVSIPEIESFLVDYLDGVFEEISTTYDSKYSRLVPNVVVSTTSQPQSYRISIDGVVYYFNEIPPMEALDSSLNEYFSSMGTSNLENEFITAGFEEAVVNSIYVGDDKVTFPGDEGTGIQGIFRNDDGGLNKRNIIGGYVILVLIVVTIALIVCRYKIGRRRKRGEIQSQSQVSESSTESSKQNDEESGIHSKMNSSGSSEPPGSNVKSAGSKTSIDNSERSSKTSSSRRSLVMKKRISRLSAKSKASTKSERNDKLKSDEEEQTRTIREAASF